jgi:hypothetical protein
MNKLLLLSALFIFSCDDDTDCFTVIDKTLSGSEYVLVGDFDTSNSDEDGPLNGYADVNLTVTEEVYNAYDIGDKYCYD